MAFRDIDDLPTAEERFRTVDDFVDPPEDAPRVRDQILRLPDGGYLYDSSKVGKPGYQEVDISKDPSFRRLDSPAVVPYLALSCRVKINTFERGMFEVSTVKMERLDDKLRILTRVDAAKGEVLNITGCKILVAGGPTITTTCQLLAGPFKTDNGLSLTWTIPYKALSVPGTGYQMSVDACEIPIGLL